MANKTLISLALLTIIGVVVQAQNNNFNPLQDYNWYYNLNTLNQATNQVPQASANINANANAANTQATVQTQAAPRSSQSCVCNSSIDPVCDYSTFTTFLNICEAVCAQRVKISEGRCGSRLPLRKSRRQQCNCSEVRNLVCVRTDFGWSDTFLNACVAECRGFRNFYQGSC